MGNYFLGVDQGTTVTTALLMDENWRIVGRGRKEQKKYFPQPGWFEEDPEDLYQTFLDAVSMALEMADCKASDIAALGFDHMGEMAVMWDRKTGKPLYNGIICADRRTADYAEQLKLAHAERIRQITGMMPDAGYTATKFRWMLDHLEDVHACLARGDLLAGTLNTWLIWKLTGGEVHVTDASSGSRMMLMDSLTADYSPFLLELMGIPREILPPIVDCNQVFGYTSPDAFLGARIPIAGCVSDSNAATIGGGGTEKGTLTSSYGTSNIMGLITGEDYILSDNGLTTTCCWRASGVNNFKMAGIANIGGAAVQWLADGLNILDNVADSQRMALSVPDTAGVYFVQAFSGLGTPYWDQYARGLLIGITEAVKPPHVVRAVLESIAHQSQWNLKVMRQDYGLDILRINADGGMVDNRFFMQFLADLLGQPVYVPVEKETAACGSAYLAGLSMGAFSKFTDMHAHIKIRCVYEPHMSEDERETRFSNWRRAVERSRNWLRPDV